MTKENNFWNSSVKYKNLTDNLSAALLFYLFSVVFELVSCLMVFGKLPAYFFFSLVTIHCFAFLIFLLPTKWFRRIFAIILFLLQVIIAITNDTLYSATGEVFTFDKLALAGNGMGLAASWMNPLNIVIYVLAFILFVVALILLPKFIKKFVPTVKQFFAISMVWLFLFVGLFSLTGINYDKNKDLWIKQYPLTLAATNYGYYGFYLPNALNFISGKIKQKDEIVDKELLEYINYVQSGYDVSSNEMTGVSAGNNVIAILAESVDFAFVDPVFTPTLYKLMTEDGIYFSNYHAENKTNMSEGMVLFGGYPDKNSLAYEKNVYLTNVTSRYSLPLLYKAQAEKDGVNAEANYFHGLMHQFYNRNNVFPELGFDNLYFGDEQKEAIDAYNTEHDQYYDWDATQWRYIKDSNFTDFNMDKIIPNTDRFFTAYASIVTHGAYYLYDSTKENYKMLSSTANKEKVEKLYDYMESQGYYPRQIQEKMSMHWFFIYKSAMMDFDLMIKNLFDQLEAKNLLDKTTVVIYPDHNAYGDSISYNIRNIYGADINKCNVNAYNMGAIIYDQKLTAKLNGKTTYAPGDGVTIDKFVSVADIYPTLCNILGLKYNKNITYGKDMFNNEARVFMTLKDSKYIFDDKFYYYGEIYPTKPEYAALDSTYFKELVDEMLYKYKMNEKLFDNDEKFIDILDNIKEV